MATKLGNLAPTSLLSSNSISPKTSFCIITTTTTTTTRIKSFPHEIQKISRPPLISVVRASSGPNSPHPTSPTNTRNSVPSPTPQDDLPYLLKLAAGSVLGAALIKYGSALLPDITKPNITLALLMISTPVVIAVLLLFNGGHKE